GEVYNRVRSAPRWPLRGERPGSAERRYGAARARADRRRESPPAAEAKWSAVFGRGSGGPARSPASSLGGRAVPIWGTIRRAKRRRSTHDRNGRRWRAGIAGAEAGGRIHHSAGRGHVRGIWNAARG